VDQQSIKAAPEIAALATDPTVSNHVRIVRIDVSAYPGLVEVVTSALRKKKVGVLPKDVEEEFEVRTPSLVFFKNQEFESFLHVAPRSTIVA